MKSITHSIRLSKTHPTSKMRYLAGGAAANKMLKKERMNRMRQISILSLCMLLILFISYAPLADSIVVDQQRDTGVSHNARALANSQYALHAPINISSNEDFLSQGWPGEGTAANPYEISSLFISDDGSCISISNTNVAFVIDHCVLTSSTDRAGIGIQFSNVSNGCIYNTSVSKKELGILLNDSQDCLVNNTGVVDNRDGAFVRDSSYCRFQQFSSISNEQKGLEISASEFCYVENCTFSSGTVGVMLRFANDISFDLNYISEYTQTGLDCNSVRDLSVSRCSFENLTTGMQSSYSWFISVSNCSFSECTTTGIMDIFCGNYVIDSSLYAGNSKGIIAVNSANSLVQNCEFLSNADSGILLYDSSNMTVHQNTMKHNNGSGIYTSYTRYSDLSSNYIEGNKNGIVLSASDGNMISDNFLLQNVRGLYLDGRCNSNIIVLNTFSNGPYGNAFDDGYDNRWTVNNTLGNTWSDYFGIGSYVVPGFAGSVDQAPQATDPIQMNKGRTLFVVSILFSPLVLVCAVFVSLIAKKKRSPLASLCVVFPGIIDNKSGDSRRVISEIAAIQKRDVRIDLVCGSISGSPITGARCYLVPQIRKEYPKSLLQEMNRALRVSLSTSIRAFSAVIASNSKAVHVHTNHPISMIAGLIAGRCTGSKCILDLHDLIPETAIAIRQQHYTGLLYWILLAFENLAVRLSNHLIVTSDGQKVVMNRRYPHKDVTVVYNPVWSLEPSKDKIQKDPSRFILVYVGELQQGIRGLEQLIDEFSQAACSSESEIGLMLIGDGDAEQELRELGQREGCSGSISFLGRMEHQKAVDLMASSDLAVVPYPKTLATEAVIPTKLLEAMSLGMPVLATNTPQFRHVIGPHGFYFDSGQEGSMRDAILEAVRMKQALSGIGAQLRERAKRYYWENSVIRLIELYDRLLGIPATHQTEL